MKKSTKGALAAAAAGTLLLGGAGSLAYWSASQTITGTSITSGHLTLTTTTCGDWQLDSTGVGGGGDLGTIKLVPGDSLTRTCTYALSASGKHLDAKLTVDAAAWTGALAAVLTPTATYKLDSSTVPAATAFSVPEGDHTVTADFTVLVSSATTVHMDESASLNSITLSVAQSTHP